MAAIPVDKLVLTLKELNSDPTLAGKRIQFKRLVQEGAAPPRFIIRLRDVKMLSDSQRKHVENVIRRAFDLQGAPVQIRFENTMKTHE